VSQRFDPKLNETVNCCRSTKLSWWHFSTSLFAISALNVVAQFFRISQAALKYTLHYYYNSFNERQRSKYSKTRLGEETRNKYIGAIHEQLFGILPCL